jgi:hypothetical protein
MDEAMHPTGWCTCAGGGQCLWCQLIDANDLCNEKDEQIQLALRQFAKERIRVKYLEGLLHRCYPIIRFGNKEGRQELLNELSRFDTKVRGEMAISSQDVHKGMMLVDEFGQVCRVESVERFRRKGIKIHTRRKEGHSFWDGTAEWSAQSFDERGFLRSKAKAL